ncbi:MAG: hypothetical protein PHF29_08415 [Candidatus Riflebacteria bacterium]|nr:hypothetical protein [Candidatus Riflebacteria bacterium]
MSKEEPKKIGREPTFNADDLAKQLLKYITESNDPIIQEFCLDFAGCSRDTLYRLAKENRLLSDTIKKCHAKQEIRTQRGVENGTINPTFGIFKLKQKCYGWSDKQELEHSGCASIKVDWE